MFDTIADSLFEKVVTLIEIEMIGLVDVGGVSIG
jgi:hypothetical protein